MSNQPPACYRRPVTKQNPQRLPGLLESAIPALYQSVCFPVTGLIVQPPHESRGILAVVMMSVRRLFTK